MLFHRCHGAREENDDETWLSTDWYLHIVIVNVLGLSPKTVVVEVGCKSLYAIIFYITEKKLRWHRIQGQKQNVKVVKLQEIETMVVILKVAVFTLKKHTKSKKTRSLLLWSDFNLNIVNSE